MPLEMKTHKISFGSFRGREEPKEEKKMLKLIAPAGLFNPEDRVKLEKMGYIVIFPFEHKKQLSKFDIMRKEKQLGTVI